LEQSDNPGIIDPKLFSNAESVAGLTLSAFIGIVFSQPRVLAALEPWAEISERLRRNYQIFKLHHHSVPVVSEMLWFGRVEYYFGSLLPIDSHEAIIIQVTSSSLLNLICVSCRA
jgi:hypothetical protein